MSVLLRGAVMLAGLLQVFITCLEVLTLEECTAYPSGVYCCAFGAGSHLRCILSWWLSW